MSTLPHPLHIARAPVSTEAATVRLILDYAPIVLVAVVFFFMSASRYALPIGPLGAVIWLGGAALLMLIKRESLGATVFKWWPLLIAPFLCFLSFAWSDLPSISGKYGFQFFLTALIGVFIARAMSPQRFAIAMFCGMLLFCLGSLASGRMGAAQSGAVLIGLTGSKNAMAFAAHMLLASAVAVLIMPGVAKLLRIAAAFGTLVGAYIVATTDSTTAILLSYGSAVLILAMWVMQRTTPAARVGAIIAAILLLLPLLLIIPEIQKGFAYVLQDVFHKDATLTGRTHLWAVAEDLLSRRPVFGHGFKSVWYGDSIEALTIARTTGVGSSGFNFHSTYWQLAVDIGLVGVGFFAAAIVVALLAGFRQFIFTPSTETIFAYSILLVTVAKSFTEVVVDPFSISTVLLYATMVYALDSRTWARAEATGYG